MTPEEVNEMKMMMEEDKEIWTPIQGFDGYEISTYGRIRSYWKQQLNEGGKKGYSSYISTEYKYLANTIVNGGYKSVKLGRQKRFLVHRLLTITFIPNPYNLLFVDHIDRNRLNNRLSNLRWCSRQQNNQNRKKQSSNTSGITGVRFYQGKWWSRWSINNKLTEARFDTKEEAIEHRLKMAVQYYDTNFYNER